MAAAVTLMSKQYLKKEESMITATFNNLQGETITGGVVMIGDAHFNMSGNKNFVTNSGVPAVDESTDNYLRYRAFYWKSQADFDAGYDAFILNSAFDKAAAIAMDPAMGDNPPDNRTVEDKLWHQVKGLDESYLSLNAQEMAIKHLTEVVFK